MSQTITLPKSKYESLTEKAKAYETLVAAISRGKFFDPPPTRKVSEVVSAFRKSGRYNKKFLESFEKGLRRSSYFR